MRQSVVKVAFQNWNAYRSHATVPTDPDRAPQYGAGPSRKLKADENEIFNADALGVGGVQEVRNERALFVYNRVQHKLTGRDFNPDIELTVPAQVEKLISQATSLENLCQSFSGWLVSSFLCQGRICTD